MKKSVKVTVASVTTVATIAVTATVVGAVGANDKSVSIREETGRPATGESLKELRRGPAEYGVDTSKVISIPNPRSKSGEWRVSPAADRGACLSLEDGQLTCGNGASIESGKFGLILIYPAEKGELGRAVRAGLTPDSVSEVRALSRKTNEVVSSTKVANNAYELELGVQGESYVQQLTSDGRVVSTFDPWK